MKASEDPSKKEIDSLYPITAIRKFADLNIGIFTVRKKWELLGIFQMIGAEAQINSRMVLPTTQTASLVGQNRLQDAIDQASSIKTLWEFLSSNAAMIKLDYEMIKGSAESQSISPTNHLINEQGIFAEPGAVAEHSVLDASAGPIFLGKNSTIMAGCSIRGPFSLGEGSVVKMNSRIYGATTVGTGSVVGGELKNVIIGNYSSKAHDGYLGDSIIGNWCNIGAGTSNSNVKNTAGDIMVWFEKEGRYLNAGSKFGMIMGDYSRCAINTAFNSGTVVGICANVFGVGLTPNLIKDFTWGYGQTLYEFDKAMQHINNWKKLKNQDINPDEFDSLRRIF